MLSKIEELIPSRYKFERLLAIWGSEPVIACAFQIGEKTVAERRRQLFGNEIPQPRPKPLTKLGQWSDCLVWEFDRDLYKETGILEKGKFLRIEKRPVINNHNAQFRRFKNEDGDFNKISSDDLLEIRRQRNE